MMVTSVRGMQPVSGLSAPRSAFRQRAGAAACRPAKPRQHSRVAAYAPPSTWQDEAASRLQQKEALLASLFESGRPMPKAGEVAKLREEIEQLQLQMQRGPGAAAPAPPRFSTTPPPPSGIARSRPSPPSTFVAPPPTLGMSSAEQMAMRAFEKVEAELNGLIGNSHSGAPDDAEVARLEVENQRLRARAHQLLAHQQNLEALLPAPTGPSPAPAHAPTSPVSAAAAGEQQAQAEAVLATQAILERMRNKLRAAQQQ